ncbi:glycoside hydrolase family 19 protein, partial [Pseudarcicella hirudinis]
AFVPAKGQKIYMNGYEIIVTSGDASAGEGLLYYPFVRQRIPVSWSGISIVEGEKGKDYGCITEGEVKAQGSNGTVVTNDLERQITALLSSGPGSYSGKFGEALEAMKTKAQELLDKIARGEKPGKEDYQEYNNICKAIKSGIESIKNTTQTPNTDPRFLAKIAPILNDLDSYKDKLLAEADCEGLGYHSELREEVFYASTKNQLYTEALVSICKLGESASLAGNILNRIEDLAVETAAAKSSIKCGCDGLMDYLTGDGNCQSVIYNLELLKRDISKNKVSHKLNNPTGGTGQVKVGEVCIDNLQIRFYGDNPEINPLSKQKTQEGIDFSATNSGNIVLNVNVLDKAEKDKKIEAVWGYLGDGDKTQEDHQATFPVTGTQLHETFPDTPQDRCDEVAALLNKYSDKFEINTPLRMAHFLGQVGHETGEFKGNSFKEGTCYSETGKWSIWFNQTWKEAPYDRASCSDVNVGHEKNNWNTLSDVPKKYRCGAGEISAKEAGKNLFCYVYRCEGGNGGEASCDGYTYRGHGFLHLTWKKQYKEFDDWLYAQGMGRDYKKVVSDPDEAFDDMEISCLSGMWYWKLNDGNKASDEAIPSNENFDEKFKLVSKVVNTKAENNENRKRIFTNAYNVLKK